VSRVGLSRSRARRRRFPRRRLATSRTWHVEQDTASAARRPPRDR
jgi:hypothetical protein